MRWWIGLVVVAIGAGVFAAGSDTQKGAQTQGTTRPALVDVLTTTYEERNRGWAVLSTTNEVELVLPNPQVVGVAGLPVKRARGGGSPPPGGKEAAEVTWKRVPWVALHGEYLERRGKASGPEEILKVVDWCEKNGLEDCAAFELRKVIQARYLMINDPAYRKFNERYLPLAEKQAPAWVYPLPVGGVTGEWVVIGDKTGFHRGKAGTNFAVDISVARDEKLYKTDGRSKEDYYAWGQAVVAQADGVVSSMINDQPDHAVGIGGAQNLANTIVLDYGGGVWGLYGHLQKGSISLHVGDKVKAGQAIGKVGMSGATGFPHLHFTLCDGANFSVPGVFRFEKFENGWWTNTEGELLTGMRVRSGK